MKKNNRNLIASPQPLDTTFEALLQEFPADLVESAREFEAFRRGRKIRSVAQLLQLVMLYCGLDYSLRSCAGTLCLLGRQISDQGVSERLSGCAAWLEHLLKEMLPAVPADAANQSTGRWILIDGSTIQVLGATGTSYRLHLAWDWVSQQIVQWILTDVKTGESLKLYEVAAGDIFIADRGYSRRADIEAVLDKGGEVLVRVAPQILPVVDEAGEKVDLAGQLWAAEGNQVSLRVRLKGDARGREMNLYAFRLPPEKAAEARRKRAARARKKGVQMKKETLEYAAWMIILSSLDEARVSAAEVAEIYRLRWQIEIVIKRLKSVLEIDCLRSRYGNPLSKVYLLGKSLYALLIARRSGQLSAHTKEVEWRVWKMMREELNPVINQVSHWKKENISQAIKQLKERKRQRKRQTTHGNELLSKILAIV